MSQILVRNLDDKVIRNLELKAELKGRSLEQELREVLTAAALLTGEEKLALVRKVRLQSPKLKDLTSPKPFVLAATMSSLSDFSIDKSANRSR
jgi:plasmid stability protein